MLTELTITNLRGLSELRLEGLTRISLLVGPNGCGKTTVLDAALLLLDPKPWRAVDQSLVERGEFMGVDGGRRLLDRLAPVLRGAAGARVTAGADSIELAPSASGNGIVIECSGRAQADARRTWWHPLDPEWLEPPAGVLRLGTAGLGGAEPQRLWDALQLRPGADHVVRLLQVLRPEIENLAWRTGEQRFVVKLAGVEEPVPAASLGGGFGRLLDLALASVSVAGGLVLADEIDTGLHHRVLPDVWRAVHSVSVASDVQFLTTTHSLDALRALAAFVRSHPEAAADVSVHRIHPGMTTTVRYSAEALTTAVEHEAEVRG